jgi:hypothetical protein
MGWTLRVTLGRDFVALLLCSPADMTIWSARLTIRNVFADGLEAFLQIRFGSVSGHIGRSNHRNDTEQQ